ncbi:MAG: DUF4384 domain-containing protein [Ignavibacteriae bacterium]|nr:MAG: DUF4384 domain-containing protein [Ignavibacteriota bacterium]
MNLRICSLFLLFLIIHSADAQTPDWAKNLGRDGRYPELLYVTGFGMAKLDNAGNRAACLESAMDGAKKNLIEKIRVRIEATSKSEKMEANEKFASYFNCAVQSSSNLEVEGLQSASYFDDGDDIGYGWVYVKRDKLIGLNRKKAEELRQSINTHLAAGKRYLNDHQRTPALDEYLACYPLFRKMEEAQAIVSSAETEMSGALQELTTAKKTDEVNMNEVQQSVDQLLQRPIASVDDIAWGMAYMLKSQITAQHGSTMVVPFSFQDTKLGSPFSRYFKQALEGQLVELAKWVIVQQPKEFNPKTRGLLKEYAEAAGAEFVLNGTYWELPEGMKLQAVLRKVSDGTIIASTEQIVSKSVVRAAGFDVRPQNFKEAFADQKDFAVDEVIDGGLSVEVWTNHGTENILYTNGERMEVFVRVNMPCYVRLIYHLADRKRSLLLDNYFMDAGKSNLAYKIPHEFECSAPFGAEVLQAIARTEKFDPLETQEVDGYQILTGDLPKILASTRGMKLSKQNVMQSETRIAVMTMEK